MFQKSAQKQSDKQTTAIQNIGIQINDMLKDFEEGKPSSSYQIILNNAKAEFLKYTQRYINHLFDLYKFLLEQQSNAQANDNSEQSPSKELALRFNLELEKLLNDVRFLVTNFHPLEFHQYIREHKNDVAFIKLFCEDSKLIVKPTTTVSNEQPQDKLSNMVETLATTFGKVKTALPTFLSSAKSNLSTSDAQNQEFERIRNVIAERQKWFNEIENYVVEETTYLISQKESLTLKNYESLIFLIESQQTLINDMRDNTIAQEHCLNNNKLEEMREYELIWPEYVSQFNKTQEKYQDKKAKAEQQVDTEKTSQASGEDERQIARESTRLILKSASFKLSGAQAQAIKAYVPE